MRYNPCFNGYTGINRSHIKLDNRNVRSQSLLYNVLVYQNNLSFSELLDLENSLKVHQNNLQVLVTEIYKVNN